MSNPQVTGWALLVSILEEISSVHPQDFLQQEVYRVLPSLVSGAPTTSEKGFSRELHARIVNLAVVLFLSHRHVIHNQELAPALVTSLSGHENGVEQGSGPNAGFLLQYGQMQSFTMSPL